MAIENQAGTMQLNFRCEGTIETPTTNQIRAGINPDGSADDILDSRDPHTGGAANFSGTDGGRLLSYAASAAIGNTEFILLEWADAIMVLFKNSVRTSTPGGIHLGKTLLHPLASLGNPGGGSAIRMDGNAILGSIAGKLSAGVPNPTNDQWLETSNYFMGPRIRMATGQTHSTSLAWPGGVSWSQTGKLTLKIELTQNLYEFGPGNELVPAPITLVPRSTSVYGSDYWFYKYLRAVPPILPRFGTFRVSTGVRYLSIGHSGSVGSTHGALAVPIPESFVANP
jgi:hypothetical protein